jgi:hypothetical protein
MKATDRQTLIRLLEKLRNEYPQWISVRTVLALMQSMDALEKLKALRKQKIPYL